MEPTSIHKGVALKSTIRRFIYRSLSFLNEQVTYLAQPSVVLCYHSINEDGWFHTVTAADFRSQMGLLKQRGYHFVSLTELIDHLRTGTVLPTPFCVITFDDGYKDVLQVQDFIRAERIRPAFFILAEGEKVAREQLGTDREFISDAEVLSLVEDGWDIGCHGARHERLIGRDGSTLQHEIIHAREILKKRLSLPIDFFAFPYGAYDHKALSFVRRGGYQAALSMDDSCNITLGKVWKLPRIGINRTYSQEEFLSALSPLAICFRRLIKLLV